MSAPTTPNTPFDAAKRIAEALQGLTTDQQSLALRFAAESLGLSSPLVQTQPTKDHAGIGSPAPASGSATEAGQTLRPDIRTFCRSKQPKTDTQLAAVVAYYYRFVAPQGERKEAITAHDLSEAIRLIGGWEQPKQPYFTLRNAKSAGYLDNTGNGQFRVNSVGENLVTMTLGGNGSEAAETSGKKKPKSNGHGGSTGKATK